jgi:hypothetical protein
VQRDDARKRQKRAALSSNSTDWESRFEVTNHGSIVFELRSKVGFLPIARGVACDIIGPLDEVPARATFLGGGLSKSLRCVYPTDLHLAHPGPITGVYGVSWYELDRQSEWQPISRVEHEIEMQASGRPVLAGQWPAIGTSPERRLMDSCQSVMPSKEVRLDVPASSIYHLRAGRVARAQMFQDTATVLSFLNAAAKRKPAAEEDTAMVEEEQ